MYSNRASPERHRQLLTRCANIYSQDIDTQSCDDEVAEIMKIAERLQDCICQKYGSTDVTTGQKPRCRMCSGHNPGLSVDRHSPNVDSQSYSSGLNSPQPETSESYIARRIEHTIQALSLTPLANHLMSQMDNTFEPVSSVTDDPSGDPYNYQTSTPPSAVRNGRRTMMRPKVIPAESFMRKYYHPYERQDRCEQSCHPYDHIKSNASPVNESRRLYASADSSYPYDRFDARHPYRKYMKRPNTATDNRTRNTDRDGLFRAIESSAARASCRKGMPQFNRPRSRGVKSDAGNDVGYDVDTRYFEEKRKQSQNTVFSTGFEILCSVLRKMYI